MTSPKDLMDFAEKIQKEIDKVRSEISNGKIIYDKLNSNATLLLPTASVRTSETLTNVATITKPSQQSPRTGTRESLAQTKGAGNQSKQTSKASLAKDTSVNRIGKSKQSVVRS